MRLSAYLSTCLFLFAGLIGGCIPTAADDPVALPVFVWDETYELAEVIDLKGVTRLGSVYDLDVSEDGSLLVVDAMQRAVFVFADNGELRFQLPLESCTHRDQVIPINGRFSQDGRFLISNQGVELLWYSSGGECMGPTKGDALIPRRYAIDAAGRIVGLHVVPDSHYVAILDEDGQHQSHLLSWTEFSGISSKVGGGGVVAMNEMIYAAVPAHPGVIEFDYETKAIREVGQIPGAFQFLADRYRDNVAVADEDADYLREALNSGSLTLHLFRVDDRTVGVRYRRLDAGKHVNSMQIVNLETGSSSYIEEIPNIVSARNGAFYVPRLYSPTGAFLPNPQIEVYRPRSDP